MSECLSNCYIQAGTRDIELRVRQSRPSTNKVNDIAKRQKTSIDINDISLELKKHSVSRLLEKVRYVADAQKTSNK